MITTMLSQTLTFESWDVVVRELHAMEAEIASQAPNLPNDNVVYRHYVQRSGLGHVRKTLELLKDIWGTQR